MCQLIIKSVFPAKSDSWRPEHTREVDILHPHTRTHTCTHAHTHILVISSAESLRDLAPTVKLLVNYGGVVKESVKWFLKKKRRRRLVSNLTERWMRNQSKGGEEEKFTLT